MDQMSGAKGKVKPKMKKIPGQEQQGSGTIHSVWCCQERPRSSALNQGALQACFNVVLSLWYLKQSMRSQTYWMKINLLQNIATEEFLFYCEL